MFFCRLSDLHRGESQRDRDRDRERVRVRDHADMKIESLAHVVNSVH